MVKTEMKDGLSGDTELTGFQDWTDAGAGEAGGGAEVPKPRAWEKDGTCFPLPIFLSYWPSTKVYGRERTFNQ